MPISPGDPLPAATFRTYSADGIAEVSSAELFGAGRVALFAVPGAFTPTCHERHMPGFVAQAGALRAKGIDRIVCVAVNDPFVVAAWGKATGALDAGLLLVSDADATFTKALGMEFDGSGAGLGVRSKRYSMLVENGLVRTINAEDAPGKADASTAEAMLAQL